jgi:hypothetical protein
LGSPPHDLVGHITIKSAFSLGAASLTMHR